MNIWDPFHPLAYFIHTVLGVAGLLCAVVALTVTKGSNPHILAGRTFAATGAIAAATAIFFSLTTFAPLTIATAALMLSVIGSALLALRSKSPAVAAGELAAAIVMALVLFWLLYGVVMSVQQGGLLWIPPVLLAILPAALLANDIRFMKQGDVSRKSKRLRRHLSRMALAFTIAIHAPVVVFADNFNIHPGLAFYGPFMIWPVVVYYFNRGIENGSVAVAKGNNKSS